MTSDVKYRQRPNRRNMHMHTRFVLRFSVSSTADVMNVQPQYASHTHFVIIVVDSTFYYYSNLHSNFLTLCYVVFGFMIAYRPISNTHIKPISGYIYRITSHYNFTALRKVTNEIKGRIFE